MTARKNLFHEIETLTPVQQESVFSFIYLLKHPQYSHTFSGKMTVEPFENEKDAVEFANYYSGKILNETR